MKQIQDLINKERFKDAASLAIYLKKTKETRSLFSKSKAMNNEKFDAFEDLLLADAKHDYDVYCRFLDYRQPLGRNFYLDRRKYLKEIADEITNMFFPKPPSMSTDVLRIKLRTRSGKSEFFNRLNFWVQGNFPSGESLTVVSGGNLKDNIHEKRVAFIDEYWERHQMVFPESKVVKKSISKSAIWFTDGEYADISTVTVGGSIEGFVQVTNLLVMDDLVASNEINSIKRMEEIFSSDIQNAVMRRYVSGKIILIGTPVPTLTGIQEPLDRFFDNRKGAGFRCKEFIVPTLNEELESNYAYRDFNRLDEYGKPIEMFTTDFFMKERNAAYNSKEEMQIATFETIHQMKPMEHGERRFAKIKTFTELPNGRYKYVNWFDPADAGSDYSVMIYGRIYDEEPEFIYIFDIFESKKPMDRGINGGYLDELFEFIKDKEIKNFAYESNMGGTLLGETIKSIGKDNNYLLEFTHEKQSKNKVQRILDNAPEIQRVVRFWDIPPTEMYDNFNKQVRSWSKNSKHDDHIDCLTSIVERQRSEIKKPNEFVRLNRPLF